MSSGISQDAMNRDPDPDVVDSICRGIRDLLEDEKTRILEEIRNYPPPIPACDLQFNHLLEQRARIAQELSRLDALSQRSLTRTDAIKLIEEFIASSSFIDDEAVQRIRASFNRLPTTAGAHDA